MTFYSQQLNVVEKANLKKLNNLNILGEIILLVVNRIDSDDRTFFPVTSCY